jgi:hypothetical protein
MTKLIAEMTEPERIERNTHERRRRGQKQMDEGFAYQPRVFRSDNLARCNLLDVEVRQLARIFERIR